MNRFIRISKISLVLVYLVILAGSLVRMTGSGMGCPDWPKCFGLYIPPTSEDQVKWTPNSNYSEGIILRKNNELIVAKKDFVSRDKFDSSNWYPYTKHDYSDFNATKTWIEFLNRLIGAIAGLFTLGMLFFSFKLWKKNKNYTLISLLIVLGMGFQAWLGKLVVDSNLAPYKITVHMLMALVIVCLIIYLIFKSNYSNKILLDNQLKFLISLSLILTLIQVITGTQVREFIDVQYAITQNKELWLNNPDFNFYFHRTFSLTVFGLNMYLLYLTIRKKYSLKPISWISSIIFLEILLGIIMYYGDFPIFSQPAHLFLATILFGLQFYWFLFFKYKN
ncbi:MAG: COX15/CtaA family protein [Bacteroidota bacterium]